MDEPTSALSMTEVEVLFRVIRELTAAGVAVVYISHHLEESLEIADDVAVLRDGSSSRPRRPPTSTSAGSSSTWSAATRTRCSPSAIPRLGEVVLVGPRPARSPTPPTRTGWPSTALDLDVRAGEIVGIYGLMASGRTELLEAIAGRLPAASGDVEFDGDAAASRIRPASASGAASRWCPRTASATAWSRRCRSGRTCRWRSLIELRAPRSCHARESETAVDRR